MVGFDAENDDAIYHSSKFIEDVPLLIIAEIGRTQISVQKVLNLKTVSYTHLTLPTIA